MCNTHDTCKKHLAYTLCLYVGPSIAIAMGLAKIIIHYVTSILYVFNTFGNFSSVFIYSHTELEIAVGHRPFSDQFAPFGRANPIC